MNERRVMHLDSRKCQLFDMLPNPYEREVNRVLEDVRNELVTTEAARREYGVVIDLKNMQVDFEAMRKLREEVGVKSKKIGGDLW